MKYGIEVNVQKNHITTFSKPTLHFRAMWFKIMLRGRPLLEALGERKNEKKFNGHNNSIYNFIMFCTK